MDVAVNDSTLPPTVLEVVQQQIFQLKLKADATINTAFTKELLNVGFSSVAEAREPCLHGWCCVTQAVKEEIFIETEEVFFKKSLHRLTRKTKQ